MSATKHNINDQDCTVLEVTVNNHPGVMSHVVGLFSRRAYNVEGILCMPMNGSGLSKMWLKVNEDGRLDQVISQMYKLEDVQNVKEQMASSDVFDKLEAFFNQ